MAADGSAAMPSFAVALRTEEVTPPRYCHHGAVSETASDSTPATAPGQSHGTTAGYRRGRRCDLCRAANAQRHRKLRAERAKRARGASFEHGPSGYINWGCRCVICTKAHSARILPAVLRYQEANREKVNRRNKTRRHVEQARTLETASRHGFQWTGPELELAARRDLTAAQVAVMIGRTRDAVQNMRKSLKTEPKIINLAGLSRETQADLVRSNT